jgi:hypothetical protein
MPTLFEYFRKETGAPPQQNCVILGKTKLDILTYSDHPDYGSSYGGTVSYSASQYDDLIAFTNFKNAIVSSHPRILIVNLPRTDNAGHSGVWASYLAGLWTADSLVNEMWNFVQGDSVMAGKTTMFVTNDHGRHDDQHGGFTNHGDGCEGCRHIVLLVIGPDTPASAVDSSARQQTDIAPTVGRLLEFATPYATGTVLATAIATGIAPSEQGFPGLFALHQNYPNPFNPATTIQYTIDERQLTTVRVYDLLGRAVSTLVNEAQQPGTYSVQFNASSLTSGVYFCRLQSGGHAATKKLMYIK